MAKRVLVIGGRGFIGYHIVHELKAANYIPIIASRSLSNSPNSDSTEIYLDLKSASDEELKLTLSSFDHIVFAGGKDDRVLPDEEASVFFYKENVIPCVRLAKACRNNKVEKIIVMGSYFSYFNRNHPEWKMTDRHPYVKSRLLQQTETKLAAEAKTQIITLELPYIFGVTPGLLPLWKPLISYINSMPLIFYTKGGTNVVAVEQVAKAIVGSLSVKDPKDHYIVGGENLPWKVLISMIALALGKKRKVIALPTFVVKIFAFLALAYFKLTKKQSGLNPYHFIDTQSANTFLETEESMRVLSYEKQDLQKTIQVTVDACR